MCLNPQSLPLMLLACLGIASAAAVHSPETRTTIQSTDLSHASTSQKNPLGSKWYPNLINSTAWQLSQNHGDRGLVGLTCAEGGSMPETFKALCSSSAKHADGTYDPTSGFVYLDPATSFPSQVSGSMEQRIVGMDPNRTYQISMSVAASGDLQSCRIKHSFDESTGTGFVAGRVNYLSHLPGEWRQYGPVDVRDLHRNYLTPRHLPDDDDDYYDDDYYGSDYDDYDDDEEYERRARGRGRGSGRGRGRGMARESERERYNEIKEKEKEKQKEKDKDKTKEKFKSKDGKTKYKSKSKDKSKTKDKIKSKLKFWDKWNKRDDLALSATKKTSHLLKIEVSCPYFPTFPRGYLAITEVQLTKKYQRFRDGKED